MAKPLEIPLEPAPPSLAILAPPGMPAHQPASRLALALALSTVYIIWGSSFLAIRIALRGCPPFLMSGTRYLLAGAVLYGFLSLRGDRTPDFRQWLAASGIGTFLILVANGGVVIAEERVTSGLAAMGFASAPLWAVIFAGFWGRWPERGEWIGVVLGFAGVALLNIDTNLGATPAGGVVLVLSAMGWAFGSVLSRYVPIPHGLMGSAAVMLSGGLMLTATGLLLGERIERMPAAVPLMAVAYLTVFSSLVGFSAYHYLLLHTRPAVFTSHAYINPVVAVALGIIFEHERFARLDLLAMAMTVVALLFITQGQEK